MGQVARSWEDSSGEQPRGGAGGRGRRGRGRGSPHLSGAGDASAADRKSKVEARGGLFLSLSHRVFQCLRLLFLSFLPPSLPLTSASCTLPVFLSPVSLSVCCMLPAPSLLLPCPFALSFWCSVSVRYVYACALSFLLCLNSVSKPGCVRGEQRCSHRNCSPTLMRRSAGWEAGSQSGSGPTMDLGSTWFD